MPRIYREEGEMGVSLKRKGEGERDRRVCREDDKRGVSLKRRGGSSGM